MSKLPVMAPAGQIWVCRYCGKYNTNRYEIGDESCMLNSVLCYEDSLKIENGRVVAAKPVEVNNE